MSQTFTLRMATASIESDAQQLGVTVDELEQICVHVSADIVQQPALHLQLTYRVRLPTPLLSRQLNWPAWQPTQVGFSDYLWEETCLECFIAGSPVSCDDMATVDHTASYIEINANPDGRYALYQFEGYRNPATLPPTPLYQADGHTRMCVHWSDNFTQQSSAIDVPLFSESSPASSYERRFGVLLTQLSDQQYAVNHTRLEYIHPCVILNVGKISLYFASSHASPPDFHNRGYWSRFKY